RLLFPPLHTVFGQPLRTVRAGAGPRLEMLTLHLGVGGKEVLDFVQQVITRLQGNPNPTPANTSGDLSAALTPPLTQDVPSDPDLARVVRTWATLPTPIKSAILALLGDRGP